MKKRSSFDLHEKQERHPLNLDAFNHEKALAFYAS